MTADRPRPEAAVPGSVPTRIAAALVAAAALVMVVELGGPALGSPVHLPDVEWVEILTGPHIDDRGEAVVQTLDGGFLLTGSVLETVDDSYFQGVLLIKTSETGEPVWTRMIKMAPDLAAWGSSLGQTPDGGFIVAGTVQSSVGTDDADVLLVRTDRDGKVLWSRIYGGDGNDFGESVDATPDGGFVVAGWTNHPGTGPDVAFLVRIDAGGNQLWWRTFVGTGSARFQDVRTTSDGGFVLGGQTYATGSGWCDVYLVKTDGNGNKLWSRTFGGDEDDWGESVRQTADGGYILLGAAHSGAPDPQVYLLKVDGEGRELWSRTLGVPGPGFDSGKSVEQMADGGYILATGNGIIRTDPMGWDLWSIDWGSAGAAQGPSGCYIGNAVLPARGGGFIAAGSVDTNGDDRFDPFLLRLGPELPVPEPRFVRGDTNGDGTVDLSDPVHVLGWLFLGNQVLACKAAGDANGDGAVDLSDPVHDLRYLFLGGTPPAEPFPDCGAFQLDADPALGCDAPPAGCE